jgi:tetratricopeptide (TPR) repeat protein
MSQSTRAPSFVVLAMLVSAGRAAAQFPPEKFTNLRVLPGTITGDSLISVMGGFTRALGVGCSYCHVGQVGQPIETYDFPSDDKVTKRKARVMLGMLSRINEIELAALEERASPALHVQCITCHRGAPRPRLLQDVLMSAYRAGGIDSTLTIYAALRSRYYGRFVYDFGEVPLADVAGEIAQAGRLADAERLHDLNVESNPSSAFAVRQFASVALLGAFLSGADSGLVRYDAIRRRFGGSRLAEAVLNGVGHALLARSQSALAVAAFRLNAEEYPASSNAHDSLGEGYAANGQIEMAIRSYEASLAIDPGNADAVARLRELRGRARDRSLPGSGVG